MFKKLLSFEITPVLALLAICVALGVFTVRDYGQSWDELSIYDYANHSIQSYQDLLHPGKLQPSSAGVNNNYGPAYFMLAMIGSRLTNRVDPFLSNISAIHFVFFLTTQICILILYLLSRRWMSRWAAFGTVLLFTSQPLIWGHSFINPKDTPFMVFFTASIYLGLQMMDTTANSKWIWIIAAGIMLGLTISIRVIGPWAGMLVFLYGLLKFPRRIISTFPYYVLIAGITTYMTWPYLWHAPMTGFIESLKIMSRFPFTGRVLFMGNLYSASQLPGSYIPTLLGLQLTEPALLLIVIGLVISLVGFVKGENREPFLCFVAWLLFPLLWIILSHSTLYDNARQLLFLWPMLFILAGLGIDGLISFIPSPIAKSALVVAIALPGILACIHLHPYEYIYYNNLIGGVKGAYRNFELDYWGTSFRESMEYLDKNAEQGATIVVFGNRLVARQYARSDLILLVPSKLDKSGIHNDYYVLSSTRANEDHLQCGDSSQVVFSVHRDGGILSYIEKISPGQTCE